MTRLMFFSGIMMIAHAGSSSPAKSQAAPAVSHVHDHRRDVSSSVSNAAALVEHARSATEIYTDRAAAVAAGYRRVGRDIPSMGEHWLSPRLIVEGKFDISRPQLLMYAKIDGKPVLTGVVYALPLKQGESPPDAFGPGAVWHEHNGSVDDEALLPEHHSTPSAVEGTRVTFLHVWTRIPASEGIFSAENWAIPFVRLRLEVPNAFPQGAARALSLLTGGREFFGELIGEAGAAAIGSSMDICANDVAAIVAEAKSEGRGLNPSELARLDVAWARIVGAVRDHVGTEAARRVNGGV